MHAHRLPHATRGIERSLLEMMLDVTQDDWQPFGNGETLGHDGSECGTVIVDEEHPSGARVCLERGGRAPFAITCGVCGWMVHTRFFSEDDAATDALRAMKKDLQPWPPTHRGKPAASSWCVIRSSREDAHRHAQRGYLGFWARPVSGQTRSRCSAGRSQFAAAHRVVGVARTWLASPPGAVRGVARKGFVLLEVAVPSS
jgi:hypothetical protein